jgi:hypothetical protein
MSYGHHFCRPLLLFAALVIVAGGFFTFHFFSANASVNSPDCPNGNCAKVKASEIGPSCYPAPSGMVLWHKAENNTFDSTPLGNGGTAEGLVTYAAGKVGQAYSFTGFGRVRVPDNPSLDLTNEFTFDAWIKPSTIYSGGLSSGAVVSKVGGPGGNNGYQFGISGNGSINDTVFCQFNEFAQPWPGNQLVATVPGGIPVGSWTHIACTYDNDTIRAYVNGVLVGSNFVGPRTIVNSSSDLRISSDDNDNVYFFGSIDEVEVFNRALSAAEIMGIVTADAAGKCPLPSCVPPPPNMTHWWRADGNAKDRVNGNDGSLVGDTTYAAGMVGQAFAFDGSGDYITVPHASAQNSANITVDAWIFQNSTGHGRPIINKRTPSNFGGYTLETTDAPFGPAGGMSFCVWIGASPYCAISPAGVAPAGVWRHVAGTFDGATVRLYVDGVLVGSTPTPTGAVDASNQPIVIGRNVVSGAEFHGLIDEIERLDRALSLSEIQGIFNAGPHGKCPTCTTAPANMVGWWKGEGNFLDEFGLNNGTPAFGPFFTGGKVGQGISLDGVDDYVDTLTLNTSSFGPSLTIDAWLKPTVLTGGYTDGSLPGVTRRTAAGNVGGASDLSIGLYGGKLGALYKPLSGVTALLQASSITVVPNTWYHVAVTKDATTARLYVNGVLVDSGAALPGYLPFGFFQIGRAQCCMGDNFGGVVDEVELFSRTLSQPEIEALYEAGSAGKCALDLPEVQLSASSYIEDESQTAVINVTRTGNLSAPSSVNISLTDGTATGGVTCASPGVDYENPGLVTLNFSIGSASQSISVPICGDLINEGTETVNITLSNNIGADLGTPSSGTLNINDTATQFRNTAPIGMTPGSPGTPNPSTINVTSGPIAIGSMRVTLYDVSQAFPDNLDVLLVGPTGAKYVLTADVGGPFAIPETAPVTLSFTDSSAAVLPDSGPLSTGQYLPTSCETPVLSFAGAPAAPYVEPGCVVSRPVTQSMFGAFGLTSPLGLWRLYVRDDNGAPIMLTASGSIAGGWGIEFLPPTAAGVEVSGRVMTPDGRGLRNATVTMTGGNGVTRSAVTSSFGYYRFEGVPVGDSFVMSVNSRSYRFKPRFVNVLDNMTDVDFIGLE